MREEYREALQLFADNRDIIQRNHRLEMNYTLCSAALLFTGSMEYADTERMKLCGDILKSTEGIFSEFRQHLYLPLLAKMALQDDPALYLEELKETYDWLNQNSWLGSESVILAAMSVLDARGKDRIDETMSRAEELLRMMDEDHPLLTGKDDLPFAVLLALREKDTEELAAEIETCYGILKRYFMFHGNEVQALCQVLALSEKPVAQKCDRVLELFDELKKNRETYGTGIELCALGLLADLPLSSGELVAEIREGEQYLKGRKGFGVLEIGKRGRLLFAVLLAAVVFADEVKREEAAAVGSQATLIIAQQITAAAAAAAAA